MTKHLLILFIISILSIQLVNSQTVSPDSELRRIVKTYGQAEVTIPEPGRQETESISRNVSIGSLKNKTLHIILSELTVEWFIKQNYTYKIVEKDAAAKGLSISESLDQAMEWESYPTYSQYDSIMQSFSSLYPDLCDIDTIGTSIMGRLVLVIKISDNAGDDEDEPEVFYTSTMHGDETGGYILMLRLADYLLKNYAVNDRVTQLVDNLEIWINPLANPDGAYRTGNTITNPVRWNAQGIDLNRNFPDPDDPGIILPKENIDMVRFMRQHNFVLSANFHSGAQVVNYPWDRWPQLHADDAWFNKISRKYADTAHFYSIPTYMRDLDNGVTRGILWYPIPGGRQDFVTYELQGREVTIELDDSFVTPASELNFLWQYNWHSLAGYLENALYGIHGIITDAVTLKPVPARIFIRGHDKDSSHIYSDTLTGSFTRFLAPGVWDLWITANGYQDTIVTNITLHEIQRIDLNIQMRPFTAPPVPMDIPLLYPNPASFLLNMMMPENIAGNVNITVFSQTGVKISDYDAVVIKGIQLGYNVSRLANGVYNVQITSKLTGASCRGRFVVIRK